MLPRKIIMPLSEMQNTKSLDTVSNFLLSSTVTIRGKTVNAYSPRR